MQISLKKSMAAAGKCPSPHDHGPQQDSASLVEPEEGLFLIDTIYPCNSEKLIFGGIRKLGLDPSNIKCIITACLNCKARLEPGLT